MSPAVRRILCAESDKDVGELLVLMLEKKGYEVRTAASLEESLRLAGNEDFDLFIVNDVYVDGDSIELCKQLRELKPLTPLLLFSLDSSGYNRQRMFDPGTKVYISRSSDFVSLVQTIDGLLKK